MMESQVNQKTIAIVGGTGKEGKGLAYRWALAGHKVIIGSRNFEKARAAVEELKVLLHGKGDITGADNKTAVDACEIAVITVPFTAHQAILEELKESLSGKLIIDVVVPLNPPKVTRVFMPPEGSAALQAKAILGESAKVTCAFNNIAYERLLSGDDFDCDVLVCGNSKEARQVVIGLVEDTGLKAWDAGPLENSMVVEGLTSILIGLNIQHKVPSSGIRITGIN